MDGQLPQVVVKMESFTEFTLTLVVLTKMIFRYFFRVRCRWCLENRSNNARTKLYLWGRTGWHAIIREEKWLMKRPKLSRICARKQSCLIIKDFFSKNHYQGIDTNFYPQQLHGKTSVSLCGESVKRFFPLLRYK